MQTKIPMLAAIPPALLEEIEHLPVRRDVSHCGTTWQISPFDVYSDCPVCKTRFKVRAFGGSEIEDVFDAVFAWMSTPEARAAAEARIEAMQDDD